MGSLVLSMALLCTSCDEDRDSNPVFHTNSELVLNAPANAANNVYDLSNAKGSITLTTSQPDNGVPVATSYMAEISLDNENFVAIGEPATKPVVTIGNEALNTKIIEMNGDVCPADPVTLYVRLKSYLSVDNTLGNAVSNVIELKVQAFKPEVTVQLPEKMYIVGSFTASEGWSKFVPLHPAYSQDGFFYGIVYLDANAEFKLCPKETWGEDRGYDMIELGDDNTSGLLSQGDGTNFKIAAGGWYTVVLKTKIAGNEVKWTLTLSAPNVYLFGASCGDNWAYDAANLFTVPADATGDFVSPAFTGAGEIRIALECGIDWWKTELTLDGDNNIYYRDCDIPSNWNTDKGADYSKQATVGGHIRLNFTSETGVME